MPDSNPLQNDISLLHDLLDNVLEEQAGPDLRAMYAKLCGLAKDRREKGGELDRQLGEFVKSLDLLQTRVAVRAINLLFNFINVAEDRQRVRVLRHREAQDGVGPRVESIADAVQRLANAGRTANDIQALLHRLEVEPVFTAHPTEAKRRTVRERLRVVRESLTQLDQPGLMPREQDQARRLLRSALVSLWQSDLLRPERPTVLEEASRALSFADTLWEVVPELYRELDDALRTVFPDHDFEIGRFLQFGSWIGGDRDGNPNVTAEVTLQALSQLRQAALRMHLKQCRRAGAALSMSDRRASSSAELHDAVQRALVRWPQLSERLARVSVHETYRRWMHIVEWRLENALAGATSSEAPAGAYRTAAQLESDITLVAESLTANKGKAVLDAEVRDWLCRIRVFGFHLYRLDIREESKRYQDVIGEVLAQCGLCPGYAALPEEEKQSVLTSSMPLTSNIDFQALSFETRETLAQFRLLARVNRMFGPEVLGAHVISMTHHCSDVLAPLWLSEWAAFELNGTPGASIEFLRLSPLFETIDDLERAPSTLQAMFANPVYKRHLNAQRGTQMVMLGYSDSTKDGGYLSAAWSTYNAQVELCKTSTNAGVRLVFFHGRGGSLGRGGGPAARSILSLPRESVDGGIRVTEQGEVLAERYDDPHVARRHLEQMTWATLLVGAAIESPPDPAWLDAMDRLATLGHTAYRALVESPGFVEFFRQATPIDEIEALPIGSRPSRRRGRQSLSDLRAIPWVFAWTQSRALLPAWYGLGSALESYANETPNGIEVLRGMFRGWAFFRATIENAALALAKADMGIVHAYTDLVADAKARDAVWTSIAREFEQSRAAVCSTMQIDELLGDTPWLQRSIRERNPYVDPLNFIQVRLLREIRSVEEDNPAGIDALRDILRVTIQGISSGMRTTG